MNQVDVLDHGYVRLVSYTQTRPEPCLSLDLDDPSNGKPMYGHSIRWNGDLEIVRNARVSHNADWRGDLSEETGERSGPKDEKLIRYLWAHNHTSPFEAMSFTFECQAPIFVLRQWHRHRTWSYNEVSARYTELPDLFYIPDIDHIRPQSKTNKQGSQMDGEIVAAGDFQDYLRAHCKNAHRFYQAALERGVARETARLFLPVNTYSRMFGTVNLLNLFRFLKLRLDSHAQYEIRVYAEAMLSLVIPICPIACSAFQESLNANTNVPTST